MWALAVLALLASCGSDDGPEEPPVVGPLPTGADDPGAYTERFLARNPEALARVEHLVMVQLEPTSEAGGAADTCTERDGVDCIPYVVDEPTTLTLAIDDTAAAVDRLVLRAVAGDVASESSDLSKSATRTTRTLRPQPVLSVEAGDDPASAVIGPGRYVLEVTHVFAGDPGAETPTIFLRPSGTADEDAASADEQTTAARPAAAARTMTLTAGRNCRGCKFANSNLTDQHFDDADLSGSAFDGATFRKTTLTNATLTGCTLTFLRAGWADRGLEGNLSDRFDADFSDAKAGGVHFSFAVESRFPLPFFAIFQDAVLDDTFWQQDTDPAGLASALRPDFRNASMRRAHFGFIVLTTPAKCPSTSRAHPDACTFEGADLEGALFDDIFFNINNTVEPSFLTVGNNLAHCRFGVEPRSERVTSLRQAQLVVDRPQVPQLDGANFSGADLSDAILDRIRLKDEVAGCGKQGATLAGAKLSGAHLTDANLTGTTLAGANMSGAILEGAILERTDLSRATLTGARVAGARWRGARLPDAVITGLIPPTFNDVDLTDTDFTGVDFAGFDLSRTNLSQATLSVPPRLAGAKLSDGTRGVNLAGHKFPPRYELFKGADLTGVDFSRTELFQANLERTIFINAKLVGTNLNFANLRGAKLRGATLGVQPGTDAVGASLRGAFMPDIDLTDADLRTVDLTAAHLYGDQQQTLLVRTRLDSASLVGAICSGAHFSGSLNNAVFDGAQLVNAVFNGATLTGAKFNDTYLQGADFGNAVSVTGVALSNAAVSAAPGTWTFTEIDGTPFIFRYEATKLGPLATDQSVRCPNGALGPCCPSGNVTACLDDKLKPARNGPFPPIPDCVPKPPRYDNCVTPRPAATPTPRR